MLMVTRHESDIGASRRHSTGYKFYFVGAFSESKYLVSDLRDEEYEKHYNGAE